MDLNNKVALITGSGIRLGKAIAIALADKNCRLALHYNSSEKSANLLKEKIIKMGGIAEVFKADLSKPEETLSLIEKVHNHFKRIDILINNAGIYPKGNGLDTDISLLQKVFQVNLFSPILLIKAFAEKISDDRQGKIINISDAKVFRHKYDHFAYRLTKNAVNEMTAMFALELAPNITVNAIAPGIMLPLAGYENIDMDAVAQRRVPLKRIGSSEIIAENVLHILEQDFMTGSIITIDGGEYL